jgi:hypothetical protein
MKIFKYFFLLVFVFSISFSFSQTNVIWFKAKNEAIFQSLTWIKLSNNLSVKNVKKALPSSTYIELSKIYEMECNCTLEEFKKATKNIPEDFYSIERGPIYQPLYVPNDLNNPAISDYALYLINAPQAWDLTQGDTNVIIAISDQDYYEQNIELTGNVTFHYDTTINTTATHGTAVAITASGNTDNGQGISSIGFNTSMALYKMTFNDILLASQAGSDVINVSWASSCFYSQLEQDVINQAVANGSIIVSAAGNGTTCSGNYVYPASYANVISVTSVGPTNNHEDIFNFGNPASTHQHNDSVDLAAPGYSVAVNPAANWFLNTTGTSWAAPYVSGTIGLMLSVNKCLSNADIENILKNTSFPLDSLNLPYAGLIGAGRLDSYQAVLAAMNMSNPIVPSFIISNGCLSNDASVQLNVQGGQSPYTATWSNNYIGFLDTMLSTNTYYVQITDIHGCVLDTSVYVVDQVNAPGNLACYENAVYVEDSCAWVISGTQPIQPSLACYEIATFDNDTCSWIISGQPITNITIIDTIAPYFWSVNGITYTESGEYEYLSSDCFLEVLNLTIQTTTISEIYAYQYSIFPNPNNGSFSILISSDETNEVSIYDVYGRNIQSFKINKSETVEMNLSSGKYFASFVSNSLKPYRIPFIVF